MIFAMYMTFIMLSCADKQKVCVISGELLNRPQSEHLILVNGFEGPGSETAIRINVEDNKFSYEIPFVHEECYWLIFEDEYNEGNMQPIKFVLYDGEVNMKLYPIDDYLQNVIEGGPLNKELYKFEGMRTHEFSERWQELNQLYTVVGNGFYTDTVNVLYAKLEESSDQEETNEIFASIEELKKEGLAYSDSGKMINLIVDTIRLDDAKINLKYIKENNSIYTYYMLIQNIQEAIGFPQYYDIDQLKEQFARFSKIFKDHPYKQYSKEVIWKLDNIKIGGSFFDFALNDIHGDEHRLSELIANKVAFIDIWAPWCGPCIQKSKSMKAVYEEFKDKNFVVGVASKHQEIQNVTNTLEKNQYPWVNLIDEPQRDSRINQHYGTENAGGGTYLVDSDGKIIAINPSIKDVRKVLTELL